MELNPRHREFMEMDDGDGAEDKGAESSYGLTFTAEDAAVRGDRDVVLPSNLLSAIAGASPSAAPGYGLFSSGSAALYVDHTRDAVIPGPNSVDATQECLVVEDPLEQALAGTKLSLPRLCHSVIFAICVDRETHLKLMWAMLELLASD